MLILLFLKDGTSPEHMSICGVTDLPDLLQKLEHFQNTEEHGKEANMSSCFVKQDFPP